MFFPRARVAVQKASVNRLAALLIAVVLWAAIYLPGLGSIEMKGEEGRRVLPAATMLEGGSWIVPEIGGKPYLRKPPLLQWCIAGSMQLFGKNDWAARLPSALGVLALVVVLVLCTRRWLIAEQSLLAAIILITQVAMIEKCRLAEIEAVYVALSGIAMVLWMSWWAEGRSPWLVWTVPFIFNGLAILAKAPLHLLFFYAIVIAVLAAGRELRRLWSLPHLAGILLLCGVVAAWAVPYFQEISAGTAGQVWKRQFVERVTGAEIDWARWLLNIPNGLGNHLPWVLFIPLLWKPSAVAGLHPRGAALVRGGRWAVAGCFIGLLLIPGVLPRYVQPLAVPFSLLLAVAIWECSPRICPWWRRIAVALTVLLFVAALGAPFAVAAAVSRGARAFNPFWAGLGVALVICAAMWLLSQRKRMRESVHLTVWTGMLVAMVILLYATAALPWIRLEDDIRPFAQRIDEAVPRGETLVAYSMDDYPPLLATLFYLEETPIAYAPEADAAPEGRRIYFVRGKDARKFRERFQIEGEPLASWQPDGEKAPAVVVWAERMPR